MSPREIDGRGMGRIVFIRGNSQSLTRLAQTIARRCEELESELHELGYLLSQPNGAFADDPTYEEATVQFQATIDVAAIYPNGHPLRSHIEAAQRTYGEARAKTRRGELEERFLEVRTKLVKLRQIEQAIAQRVGRGSESHPPRPDLLDA